MKCPNCKNQELSKKLNIKGVQIESCHLCGGFWFEKDELRKVKDDINESAKWFDFDLWKDKTKFTSKKGEKLCPKCNVSLYLMNYGGSDITIDVCRNCEGIWLDKGEFEKIMNYVRESSYYEVLNNYSKNLIEEAKEVFTGSEGFKSEIVDLFTLLKLFQYKFATQHQLLTELFLDLPK